MAPQLEARRSPVCRRCPVHDHCSSTPLEDRPSAHAPGRSREALISAGVRPRCVPGLEVAMSTSPGRLQEAGHIPLCQGHLVRFS